MNVNTSKTTRVVGYLRVSTDQQADNGCSLEVQKQKITDYARLYDLEVVAFVEDAGSGKSLQRPGLQNALKMLRGGQAEGVLIAKLDRLTRSVRDLGWLVENFFSGERFQLLSVADHIDTRSAAGRLVLNVLASVSQWEREVIAERTTEALRHKKEVEKIQLGQRTVAQLAPEIVQQVQQLAREMKVVPLVPKQESLMSQRQFLQEVVRRQVPTPKGASWHLSTLQAVLNAKLSEIDPLP